GHSRGHRAHHGRRLRGRHHRAPARAAAHPGLHPRGRDRWPEHRRPDGRLRPRHRAPRRDRRRPAPLRHRARLPPERARAGQEDSPHRHPHPDVPDHSPRLRPRPVARPRVVRGGVVRGPALGVEHGCGAEDPLRAGGAWNPLKQGHHRDARGPGHRRGAAAHRASGARERGGGARGTRCGGARGHPVRRSDGALRDAGLPVAHGPGRQARLAGAVPDLRGRNGPRRRLRDLYLRPLLRLRGLCGRHRPLPVRLQPPGASGHQSLARRVRHALLRLCRDAHRPGVPLRLGPGRPRRRPRRVRREGPDLRRRGPRLRVREHRPVRRRPRPLPGRGVLLPARPVREERGCDLFEHLLHRPHDRRRHDGPDTLRGPRGVPALRPLARAVPGAGAEDGGPAGRGACGPRCYRRLRQGRGLRRQDARAPGPTLRRRGRGPRKGRGRQGGGDTARLRRRHRGARARGGEDKEGEDGGARHLRRRRGASNRRAGESPQPARAHRGPLLRRGATRRPRTARRLRGGPARVRGGPRARPAGPHEPGLRGRRGPAVLGRRAPRAVRPDLRRGRRRRRPRRAPARLQDDRERLDRGPGEPRPRGPRHRRPRRALQDRRLHRGPRPRRRGHYQPGPRADAGAGRHGERRWHRRTTRRLFRATRRL
ncbi:MAG: Inner membrane protein, KefB/KefC family, partial [uncultured Rubrobacteraceae bacterium]